jgi:serine/threonine-protein kinase
VALGAEAIPEILKALATAEKTESLAYVEALSALADNKTLPLLLQGLAAAETPTVTGVTWALARSQRFTPALLLTSLKDHSFSGNALLEIIAAHKRRIPVRDLLLAASRNDVGDKNALFKIIAEVADDDAVPELLSRLSGKDVGVRVQLISILSRFQFPEVQDALLAQLAEPQKLIRQAALIALGNQSALRDVSAVIPLLTDPDMELSNRGVELLIRVRHPDTVQLLAGVLKDESEYARRAAVEVLNELGNKNSIKHLFEAIKDSDWWVRSRAADALGKIGGPRVVDAVLELIGDPDEDIRRTAIEILNQTKDKRAISHLLAATRDQDWWVSERAVDALADMGVTAAIPRFREMLAGEPRSLPVVIRAIGRLGDGNLVDELLPFSRHDNTDVALASLQALDALTDVDRLEKVTSALSDIVTAPADRHDTAVVDAARRAIESLEARLADTAATSRVTPLEKPSPDDSINLRDLVKRKKTNTSRLDVSMLRQGDMLEDRYRFIEKIGKGAFGTVLLMLDTAVDEQLVLKFLNPGVAEDEEILQRFVYELRNSRKISHPNVIRIYDFLHIRGNYAISMEYFPSHTLSAEISRHAPLPLDKAIRFGLDIINGMASAHQAGIVHRDLKPANVLINDSDLVKIVDFGVSAAVWEADSQLTRTGYVIGSPKYMAPEQILGKETDPRADIYSTGVMLYEMLTGQPPYSKGDHMAVMYQHVQGKAATPKELRPELPEELSSIVMTAMAVDRQQRFPTMDEFRNALEAFTRQAS